jgi:putative phosphoesterase
MEYFELGDGKQSLRVAVVSDTHANLDQRVAEVAAGCDAVIHAGDICAASVLDELKQVNDHVVAIAGNNDHAALWPIDDSAVVNNLPAIAHISVPGGLIMVEHGHRFGNNPDHGELRAAHPEARMVIYGHTHRQVWDADGDTWVLNPGAAGYVRNHGGPACVVLTLTNIDWDVELIQFAEQDGQAA